MHKYLNELASVKIQKTAEHLKDLRAQERAAAQRLAEAQRAYSEAEALVHAACDDLLALGLPGHKIAEIT